MLPSKLIDGIASPEWGRPALQNFIEALNDAVEEIEDFIESTLEEVKKGRKSPIDAGIELVEMAGGYNAVIEFVEDYVIGTWVLFGMKDELEEALSNLDKAVGKMRRIGVRIIAKYAKKQGLRIRRRRKI